MRCGVCPVAVTDDALQRCAFRGRSSAVGAWWSKPPRARPPPGTRRAPSSEATPCPSPALRPGRVPCHAPRPPVTRPHPLPSKSRPLVLASRCVVCCIARLLSTPAQLVSAYLSQRAKLLTAGKTPAEAAGHAAASAQAALQDVQRATSLANDVGLCRDTSLQPVSPTGAHGAASRPGRAEGARAAA